MVSLAREETIGYEDFRIELLYKAKRETFELHAITSAGFITLPDFRCPLSFKEVEDAFAGITRSNAQFTRSIARGPIDNIKTLGSRLFFSLYENRVGELYQKCSVMAAERGRNLRLRFVLNHPWMAAMPWEFLFDPNRMDFLTLSTRSPIVRQWAWPTPGRPVPSSIEPPLRVLVAIAEVKEADRGTAAFEIKMLKQFESESALQIEILNEATPAKLINALGQNSFHMLHLIMSGALLGSGSSHWRENHPDAAFHEPPQYTLLMLSDTPTSSRGGAESIDIGFLSRIISQKQNDLQLINFSGDQTDWLACQTTATCPATIGWRGYNTAEAYLSFAKGFYAAVVDGTPLEVAVTHGRKEMDAEYPGGKEWGMPVFYMQTENSFTLRQPRRETTSSSATRSIPKRKSKGPHDPSSEREWKKFQLLLASAEENHQALLEEVKKFDNQAVPDYVKIQLDEEKNRINELRAKLKKLM
jgi:hypothetical protein